MKIKASFPLYVLILGIVFSILIACSPQKQESLTQTPPYDGSWEALQKMPVPDWFNDGKVGIFIHWGPYSVIGHRKFAKQIESIPAKLNLPELPAGYGFQFEVKITDTTENEFKPILDKVVVKFEQ